MALAGIKPLYTRNQIVGALATLRKEWEASNPGSLIRAKGSVGLILADLGQSLALEPDEQKTAFGGRLLKELKQEGVISSNGHNSQVSKPDDDWQPESF